jgi:protein-S-isoprenylcysteine O-methyltransferase Ste14
MFLAAGTLRWWEGWAYLGVIALYFFTATVLIPFDAELAEERTSIKEDVKTWDKILASVLSLLFPLGFMALGGLDVRFDWSPGLPAWLEIASLALVAGSLIFMGWAAYVNDFYGRYVRIQTERGHHVVKAGPYRVVRHPAYLGTLVFYVASALALGSLWTLVLSGFTIALTVLRTALEDRTLRAELPGYEDFTHETRFRLIPGVW